jgi:hypothetical protein
MCQAFFIFVLLFVNNNAAAANCGRRIIAVVAAELIVVDNITAYFVPNFDTEFILTAAAIDLTVNCRQHKAVIAAAIDCSRIFELRFSAGNY